MANSESFKLFANVIYKMTNAQKAVAKDIFNVAQMHFGALLQLYLLSTVNQ